MSEQNSPKLFVGNEAQRVILVHEMMGQLSDGYWENARPWQHFKPWHDAEVVVAKDGKVGRNFPAAKDNYNFANPDLLSAIGDRILLKVKAMLLGFDESVIEDLPDSAAGYDDYMRYAANDGNDYWVEIILKLNDAGINASTIKALEEWDGYTMKDLVKDCKALKVAFQTQL